jgi:hypothetical protein
MNVYELGTKLGEWQEWKASDGELLGCLDGVDFRISSSTNLEGNFEDALRHGPFRGSLSQLVPQD